MRLLAPKPAAFGIGNIARAGAILLAAGNTPPEKLIQHASHRVPRRASYFGALYQLSAFDPPWQAGEATFRPPEAHHSASV